MFPQCISLRNVYTIGIDDFISSIHSRIHTEMRRARTEARLKQNFSGQDFQNEQSTKIPFENL